MTSLDNPMSTAGHVGDELPADGSALPENSYWVVPGKLGAGEYPGSLTPQDATDKLKVLLGAGIRCFVDLTHSDDNLLPYSDLAVVEADRIGTEILHVRRPILDSGLPDDPRHMMETLDVIDESLKAGQGVYVHCWGGIGRTGTVVGCWLVRHGLGGDEALRRIQVRWQGMEKIYRVKRSPELDHQREYIRNWREP